MYGTGTGQKGSSAKRRTTGVKAETNIASQRRWMTGGENLRCRKKNGIAAKMIKISKPRSAKARMKLV
jgi:hypothetical protein